MNREIKLIANGLLAVIVTLLLAAEVGVGINASH
jgi:hypothetical protein